MLAEILLAILMPNNLKQKTNSVRGHIPFDLKEKQSLVFMQKKKIITEKLACLCITGDKLRVPSKHSNTTATGGLNAP